MASLVVAMYEKESDAKAAHDELERVGGPDRKVHMIKPGQNEMSKLTTLGIPQSAAGSYDRGLKDGLYLVGVKADKSDADEAGRILDKHHSVDVEERYSGSARTTSTATGATADRTTTTTAAAGASATRTAEAGKTESIPVVEEEVKIGKRQVEGGGMRVYTHVIETPVEEDVQLREEHVDVQRRKVDRPATDADFQDKTIEATETREEAVVSKTARVVEEIIISKEADVRTEHVQETVRKTDVEIERLGVEDKFRSHYDTAYAKGGQYQYEQVKPAYRYGAHMATQKEYSGRNWSDVESDARTHFERRNPGAWEQFKGAVKHGYESTKSAVT